jgi:predicted ATPase
VIAGVIPEIANVFPNAHIADSVNMSPAEIQARFINVFVQFIRVFASKKQFLVMFLDDVQVSL